MRLLPFNENCTALVGKCTIEKSARVVALNMARARVMISQIGWSKGLNYRCWGQGSGSFCWPVSGLKICIYGKSVNWRLIWKRSKWEKIGHIEIWRKHFISTVCYWCGLPWEQHSKTSIFVSYDKRQN